MEGNYAGKDHVHKPKKGQGSYDRKEEKELAWTWEEEEAFREIAKRIEDEEKRQETNH